MNMENNNNNFYLRLKGLFKFYILTLKFLISPHQLIDLLLKHQSFFQIIIHLNLSLQLLNLKFKFLCLLFLILKLILILFLLFLQVLLQLTI